MQKYHYHDTISLSAGCKLLDTNLPNLKRRADKKCFQIVEIGEKFRRIPTLEMLDYCQILLEKNKEIQHHLESSISELRTKNILSRANTLGDDDLKEEFKELFQEFAVSKEV